MMTQTKRKEIVMSSKDNFSNFFIRYQKEQGLSIAKLATICGVAKSGAEIYLDGSGNPRLDIVTTDEK